MTLEDLKKRIANRPIEYIPIGDLVPDHNQSRKYFDETKLKELAKNIEKYGILQPLIYRKKNGQKISVWRKEMESIKII